MPSLTVGSRFKPTGQEILGFLEKKVKGDLVVHDSIIECDIYGEKEPWLMFDKNAKDDVYVFTKLKTKSKSRIQRTAGCGTWVGQRSEEIYESSGFSEPDDRVIGFKKLFIFSTHGKRSSRENGHWIMHEFSIAGEGSDHKRQNNNHKYVLCRIRNKCKDKVDRNVFTRSEFEDIISGTHVALQVRQQQDNIDDSINNHSREHTTDDEKELTRLRKSVRHNDDVNIINVATDQGAQECERILSWQKPQITVADLQQKHQLLLQQQQQQQQQQLQADDPLAPMTMGQQSEFYQQQKPYYSHELIDSSHKNQYVTSYFNWNTNPAYANLHNDSQRLHEPVRLSMGLDVRQLMALLPSMNATNYNGQHQNLHLVRMHLPDHQLPAFPATFSFGIPFQGVPMNNNSFIEEPPSLNPISLSQENHFGVNCDAQSDTMSCPSPMNVTNYNGHLQGPYLAEIQAFDHQLPAFPTSFSFGIPSQRVPRNNNSLMEEPPSLNSISFSPETQFGVDCDTQSYTIPSPPPINVTNYNDHQQGPYVAGMQSPDYQGTERPVDISSFPSQEDAANNNSFREEPQV